MMSLGSITGIDVDQLRKQSARQGMAFSLCGMGRSWTDTFLGPSKTTAFIVFAVDMSGYTTKE